MKNIIENINNNPEEPKISSVSLLQPSLLLLALTVMPQPQRKKRMYEPSGLGVGTNVYRIQYLCLTCAIRSFSTE